MSTSTGTTPTRSTFSGTTYLSALNETPQLVLSCYSFGWMLRKTRPDTGGITEYPVDPTHIAEALATEMEFSTGLMPDDIIYHRQAGPERTVVGFRPRQRTGIWLEGHDDPLRVPLPHLLLIKTTRKGQADYKLFAATRRPESLTEPLYNAPLPNVYRSGNICWGNISVPDSRSISLKQDWETFFGTRFGNHACAGKSASHRGDVREMLLALNNNQRRRVYPGSELVEARTTLANVLNIDTGDTA